MTPGIVEQFCFNNMLPVSIVGAGVGGIIGGIISESAATPGVYFKRFLTAAFMGFVMYFWLYDTQISAGKRLAIVTISGYLNVELLDRIKNSTVILDLLTKTQSKVKGGGNDL